MWRDKIALVTGGSSGIGLAVARSLAARGAHVWVLARREKELQNAVEAARCSADQRCGAVTADVSDWEQVVSAVSQIEEKVGVPDLVINSAGVAHPGYFQELDLKIFHWMMDVNYFGTVHITKAVLPGMLARGSGHIVNISSGAGFLGFFGYTAYGASKFAVRGFSDALRAELKPLGINVSIVFPPDVDTPQLAYDIKARPPEIKTLLGSAGLMTPEAVAETIIRQVSRRRYLILPGLEVKLLFWLVGLIGSGVYPIMDLLIALSRRKNLRGGSTNGHL